MMSTIRGLRWTSAYVGGRSCSDYVRLGRERIFVRVQDDRIIMAEAPPDAGAPHLNRKWVAGVGPVGLEAGALIRAAVSDPL